MNYLDALPVPATLPRAMEETPLEPSTPSIFSCDSVSVTSWLNRCYSSHLQFSNFGICDFIFCTWNQSRIFLSRNAFAMTETELKLIAAPAIIGLSRRPETG